SRAEAMSLRSILPRYFMLRAFLVDCRQRFCQSPRNSVRADRRRRFLLCRIRAADAPPDSIRHGARASAARVGAPSRISGRALRKHTRRTTTIAFLLLSAGPLLAQEPKPPALTPEERKLAADAWKLDAEGTQLYRQGQAAEAVAKKRQALQIFQKIYPTAKYP